MLYLLGQIAVFVLVALVVGAALAWIFVVGPLRRRAADAQRALWAADGRASAADRARQEAVAELARAREEGTGPWPVLPVQATGTRRRGPDVRLPEAAGGEPAPAMVELTARLRRQEADSALEKAELAARLATAEQQAAESELRVATAEDQVASAQKQLAEAESRVTAAERELVAARARAGAAPAEPPGSEREIERLRAAVADAEGRAAKFSSRLAMIRTEAEDAQRQVATMSTRLDRHQAEWAAERVRLLGRIAAAGERVDRDQPDDGDRPDREHLELDQRDPSDLDDPDRDDRPPVRGGSPHPIDALDRLVPEPGAGRGSVNGSHGGNGGNGARGSNGSALTGGRGLNGSRASNGGRGLNGADHGDFRAGFPRSRAPWDETFIPNGGGGPDGEVAAEEVAAEPAAEPAARPARREVHVPPLDDVADGRPPRRSSRRPDNLKEIVGIGPIIEGRLRDRGITTFRQLATLEPGEAETLLDTLETTGSIEVGDWISQARHLHSRKYGELV